jgi:HAD superfamily hydrolase (TIGR01490 family)
VVTRSQQPIAAFFDIDNTVMRGASIYHLARGLFDKGVLTASDLASYALAQGKLLTTASESQRDLARISANALAFARGRSSEELMALCTEVYDDVLADRVWPGTVELAQWHLHRGHEVWLVSAAPIELAGIIADRLGLAGAIATRSEIVDGFYTGRLATPPMHGPQKAQAVADLAAERGFDLSESYAYSDSQHDLPLLELVGHPVAVNPDGALRQRARELGWPVHDFRREHLKTRYAGPAKATAVAAIVGAGVGMAVAATRSKRGARE